MKKKLLGLVASLAGILFAVTPQAHAAQIPWWWFESFTYPGGSVLIGQTSPGGLTWVAAGSGAVQPTVQPGNLPVPGLDASTGIHARIVAADGPSARLQFEHHSSNTDRWPTATRSAP